MPITAQTYHDALNTINPHTVDPNTGQGGRYYNVDEVNSFILGQPGGIDALKGMQTQGGMRYIGGALSEGLTGLESLESVPAAGINYLSSKVNPMLQSAGYGQFPQVPDIQNYTNRIGLTNNPAYMPGLGPHPEAEILGAAAARGIGGSLPALAMGPVGALGVLGAGAAGSVASEAVHQLYPDSTVLPLAAGIGTAALGGGLAGLARGGYANSVVNSVVDNLGAKGATLATAGRTIQDKLLKLDYDDTNLPGDVLDRLTKLTDPSDVSKAILKKPSLISTMRDEFPAETDQLAGARLNINPTKFLGYEPEAKAGLITNSADRKNLTNALTNQSAGGLSVAGGLGLQELGTGLGALAAHMGYIPGGEVAGGVGGALVALRLAQFHSNTAARAILDPFVRQIGIAGGLGAASNIQRPYTTFASPANGNSRMTLPQQ